jgi:hypothetical protein
MLANSGSGYPTQKASSSLKLHEAFGGGKMNVDHQESLLMEGPGICWPKIA